LHDRLCEPDFRGIFLPGDSLLVTAGILSAGEVIPLKWLLLPVMLCAILGDQIGYWIGRAAGSALYRREDSLFFRRSHLQRARDFYQKYGGRAVILARFVPIVRTFCPPVAGAAQMPYCAISLMTLCAASSVRQFALRRTFLIASAFTASSLSWLSSPPGGHCILRSRRASFPLPARHHPQKPWPMPRVRAVIFDIGRVLIVWTSDA
jgi:membrane protein DedA with SNARE-associated domain